MSNLPFKPAAPGAYGRAVAITKSDSTVYDPPVLVWVGGLGDVAVVPAGQTTAVTFSAVPAGTLLPITASKVMSANTTATLMVGLS